MTDYKYRKAWQAMNNGTLAQPVSEWEMPCATADLIMHGKRSICNTPQSEACIYKSTLFQPLTIFANSTQRGVLETKISCIDKHWSGISAVLLAWKESFHFYFPPNKGNIDASLFILSKYIYINIHIYI